MGALNFTKDNVLAAEEVRVKGVFRAWTGTSVGECDCYIDCKEPEFQIIKKALIEAAEKREERLRKEQEQKEYQLYLKLKEKFEKKDCL